MRETLSEKQFEAFRSEMKRIRKESGMSQYEFAEYVGKTQPFIANIEVGRNKTTVENAKMIADALGVKLSDMFVTEDSRKKKEWKEYGKSLIRRRTEKGFTPTQVAQVLGIPRDVYMRYEEGVCLIQDREKATLDKLLGAEEQEVEKVEKAEKVEFSSEIPYEIVDVIIKHVKDLKVSEEIQRKVYRYFAQVQMEMMEKRIFG